jgi:hypothetical protein
MNSPTPTSVRLLYSSPTAVAVSERQTNAASAVCVLHDFLNRSRHARLLSREGLSYGCDWSVHIVASLLLELPSQVTYLIPTFC